MDAISSETLSDFKKLGIYQIIGGTIGLIRLATKVLSSQNYNAFTNIFYSLFLVMFSYSCFAGWLCIKKDSIQPAIIHSTIYQWLQVPGFSIAGYLYYYSSGVGFYTGFNFTKGFTIQFDTGLSNVQIYINSNLHLISFMINLVAIFAIYWLNKLKKQATLEADLSEVRNIGKNISVK